MPVIVSQPRDFNTPDLAVCVCPGYPALHPVPETDYHELPPLATPAWPNSVFPSLQMPGQCAPQQRLYFRPEPHGQGSLRPTLRPKAVGSS